MSGIIPTLTDEIERFGEVRDGGCLLRVENGEYVMEECRNIFNRHRLDVASTSEDRLEAHWSRFVRANRLGAR